LQECLKEKRKEIGKGVWKEREAYFERNGYAGAEIERMRERESNDRRIGAEE
jgi:hypothetical protein